MLPAGPKALAGEWMIITVWKRDGENGGWMKCNTACLLICF
jgi:hypothetical protein